MNLYVRYFDHETVSHTGEGIINFLVNLHDFNLTPQMREEILSYAQSNMPYPKRIKVRGNLYFILIKTTAPNLTEFKAHRKDGSTSATAEKDRKDPRKEALTKEARGWYHGTIIFRRVVLVPGTQKCSYRDTRFSAYVYANSGADCYTQMIEHLRNRQDIDPRSQFPSEKKNNYAFRYLGDNLPVKA